ncbi:MAG: helix-turn-helix transcriptional regulator [Bacilli bacterium]|nr:helix-turn-helix transcriptional regulator [Bacilli bacterium]
MIDFVRVGNKITEYRKSANMTQDELADLLFVTRQALSKWENGKGVPSADTLLALCKIFNVSFEEILCLDEKIDVDKDNIFKGHQRLFIIKKIISNETNIYLPDVFYQFSPSERMLVLKAIKEKKIHTDIDELYVKLTNSEKVYLGGKL